MRRKLYEVTCEYITPKRKSIKSTHVHITAISPEEAIRQARPIFKGYKLNIVKGSIKTH
jgi:hypothetical protein